MCHIRLSGQSTLLLYFTCESTLLLHLHSQTSDCSCSLVSLLYCFTSIVSLLYCVTSLIHLLYCYACFTSKKFFYLHDRTYLWHDSATIQSDTHMYTHKQVQITALHSLMTLLNALHQIHYCFTSDWIVIHVIPMAEQIRSVAQWRDDSKCDTHAYTHSSLGYCFTWHLMVNM